MIVGVNLSRKSANLLLNLEEGEHRVPSIRSSDPMLLRYSAKRRRSERSP